ncbi:MAG: hypothetical protein LC637_08935 [Xanthomonadaceae bacterium]|nr:hypothetical protein [Xanthomonadaceae bacterium]
MTARLALAAGELSGDRLGASLASALYQRDVDVFLSGLTGPAMIEAGVESMASIDELGVMGLFEVVSHLPRLMRLRRGLRDRILRGGFDAFVGIDSPDFNLGLARSLRRAGVPSIQCVAPSVWAWRRYRIPKIARSWQRPMLL